MEHNKMILAIVRGEDHYDTVHALNEKGFYVTVLSTSGGFLRQKNTTLMICTDESRVEEALAILKRVAGKRTQTVYQSPCAYSEHGMVSTAAMVPPVARRSRCASWNVVESMSTRGRTIK